MMVGAYCNTPLLYLSHFFEFPRHLCQGEKMLPKQVLTQINKFDKYYMYGTGMPVPYTDYG